MRAGGGLTRWRELAYAGVNIPFTMMQTPAFIILPSLYVQYSGLSMVTVGFILTALRVADAIIDPGIGFLSDRTRSRFGRRKPFIVLGGLIGAPAVLLAYHPSATTGYVYFALSYLFLTLGWTLSEIPHTAWLSEITRNYSDRNRLATYRYIAGMVGTALFPLISFLPWLPSRAITPQVTGLAGWVIFFLTMLTVPLALFCVPQTQGDTSRTPATSVKRLVKDLLANRPLHLFLAMQTLTGVSSGMVSGLYFFYISNYLRLSEDYSLVMLAVYGLSIAGGAMWLWLGRIIDKHRVNAICSLLVAVTNLMMVLIAPGPRAFELLIGVFSIAALCTSGAIAAQTSLLADVCDFGTLRSGRDHAGNYFAAFSFINKSSLAIGSGLGMIVAGVFGFRPTGNNGAHALTGFFLAIVWIPLALNLLSAAVSWFFPLDRRRQGIVSRRLALLSPASGQIPSSEGIR
jgi:Na+/melibiose symporter-like transporter